MTQFVHILQVTKMYISQDLSYIALCSSYVKNKIPFQRLAASRSTGTDTDAFAYSNDGVASCLISLPLRYMHTTVETAHKEDVENVIHLIYETLLTLKDGQDFRYLK